MPPKISIIVPVYNAGNYFRNCLESLVNQTLRESEIILVLDCPTDGSDKIAEEFARQDNRIKLIYNTKNLHVGFCRNKGISEATGEYLAFCDHDDICNSEMYEKMYIKAKTDNSDIVRCGYIFKSLERKIFVDKEYKTPEDLLVSAISKQTVFMWNHIFRAGFIRENNIEFVDTKKIVGEDTLFLIESCFYADSLTTIKECLYTHVVHPEAVGAKYSYFSVFSMLNYYEYLKDFLSKNRVLSTFEDLFFCAVAWDTFSIMRNSFKGLTFKETVKNARVLKKNKEIQAAIYYLFLPKNFKVLKKVSIKAVLCLIVLRIIC